MVSKTNSTYIKREYRDVPFLLSPSNLVRIYEILEKRYDQVDKHENTNFEFSVRLADRKQIVLDDLESVLALDNPVNNRILELELDYDRKKNETQEYVKIRFNGTPLWPGITITGESTNSIWLNETVAGLEEQIERTILDDFIYKVKSEAGLSGLLGILALLTSLFILIIAFSSNVETTFYLSDKQVNQLIELSSEANTDAEKLDFIYNYLAATLENHPTSPDATTLFTDARFYLIAVPVLFVLFILVYLFFYCYPKFIFKWGDYATYHDKLVERRKTLWNAVVIALFVGIFGNLFVLGLSSTLFE